jgi:hypothetical protein
MADHRHILGRFCEGEEKKEEGKKLEPSVVLYLTPDEIKVKEGAHCGACFFFHRSKSECFLTSPPACNAEHGVCGFYLGGDLEEQAAVKPTPQKLVPKTVAGYIEKAPTHCANCEYFGGEEYPGECSKVKGHVDANGCCNQWEEKAESDS